MINLGDLKRKDFLINGVYMITNIKNGRTYIGSSSSKYFIYNRLINHRRDLKENRHCNIYLQRDFNKCGIKEYYVSILEICEPDECIEREQYWIDLLKPNYNLLKIAGSSKGRICLNETREKISKSNKEFWKNNRDKMIESFKKRVFTPRKKGYKLNKRKIYSEEGYKSLVKSTSKRVIDLETNITYDSLKQLSEAININYTRLSSIVNDKLKYNKMRNRFKYE